MTVDLRPLALEAGASPSPNIRIDAGPDEVVPYQSLCCSDSWVGERVEHVKDGATELYGCCTPVETSQMTVTPSENARGHSCS